MLKPRRSAADSGSMTPEYAEIASSVCHQVARAYAVRWRGRGQVDEQDAIQQCWVVCLDVWARWRPEDFTVWGGRSAWRTYCYVACNRILYHYLPRQAASVTGSQHRISELRACQYLELQQPVPGAENTAGMELPVRPDHGDHAVNHPRTTESVRAQIRQRIHQLAGETPKMRAAALVWLDGFQPSEAAARVGVTPAQVYTANAEVRSILKSDRRIRELAAELAAEREW